MGSIGWVIEWKWNKIGIFMWWKSDFSSIKIFSYPFQSVLRLFFGLESEIHRFYLDFNRVPTRLKFLANEVKSVLIGLLTQLKRTSQHFHPIWMKKTWLQINFPTVFAYENSIFPSTKMKLLSRSVTILSELAHPLIGVGNLLPDDFEYHSTTRLIVCKSFRGILCAMYKRQHH